MKRFCILAAIAFSTGIVFTACKTKSAAASSAPAGTAPVAKAPCSENPTYTLHVKKIIDTHCATPACHSASRHADGIDLSSYEKVKSQATYANFLGSIRHESEYALMPKNAAKLADSTITTISCWVSQGLVR